MTHVSLQQVVAETTAALADVGVDYALLGGFAVNAYGFPRMTRDVDVCVALPRQDPAAVDRLVDALVKRGFRANRDAIRERVSAGRQLITLYLGLTRLDVFLRGEDEAWHQVLAQRQRLPGLDMSLWFASAEDIIAMKLAAGRPRDLDDARALVAIRHDALDLARLRRNVAEYEARAGRDDMTPALAALIAENDGTSR